MDLYSNVSTTYTPNCFQQQYPYNQCIQQNPIQPVSPNKPFEIVKNNEVVGYFWYQGNSIDLVFDIPGVVAFDETDNYIEVSDLINALEFEASFYDFRGIRVLQFTNTCCSGNQLEVSTSSVPNYDMMMGNTETTISVKVPISAEISSKLVKGVYKFDLVATHPSGYRETLFNGQQATFEVR